MPLPNRVDHVALDHTGKRVATSDGWYWLRVWDLEDGRLVLEKQLEDHWDRKLLFTPDSEHVILAGAGPEKPKSDTKTRVGFCRITSLATGKHRSVTTKEVVKDVLVDSKHNGLILVSPKRILTVPLAEDDGVGRSIAAEKAIHSARLDRGHGTLRVLLSDGTVQAWNTKDWSSRRTVDKTKVNVQMLGPWGEWMIAPRMRSDLWLRTQHDTPPTRIANVARPPEFSGDGSTAAVLDQSGRLLVMKLPKWKTHRVLHGSPETWALSHDGTLIALSSKSELEVRRIEDGTRLRLKHWKQRVGGMCFSPTGRRLAVSIGGRAGEDRRVIVFDRSADAKTWLTLETLDHPRLPSILRFENDQKLWTMGLGLRARRWLVEKRNSRPPSIFERWSSRSAWLSKDCRFLLELGDLGRGSGALTALDRGMARRVLMCPDGVNLVAASFKHEWAAAAGAKSCWVWDLRDEGIGVRDVKAHGAVIDIDLDDEGSLLAIGSARIGFMRFENGTFSIIDPRGSRRVIASAKSDLGITTVRISPDRRWALAGAGDLAPARGELLAVELNGGGSRFRRRLKAAVFSVAIHPRRHVVAVGTGLENDRGEVLGVSPDRGDTIWRIPVKDTVSAVAWHPTRASLLIIGTAPGLLAEPGELILWDTDRQQVIQRQRVSFPVTSLAFARGGTILGAGGGHMMRGYGAVAAFDVTSTPRIRQRFATYPRNGFVRVAFSGNGRTLFASYGKLGLLRRGEGGAIALDSETGKELYQFDTGTGVSSIATTHDGLLMAAGCLDGRVRLTEMQHSTLLEELGRRVPRALTRKEWRHFFGDRPYSPAVVPNVRLVR